MTGLAKKIKSSSSVSLQRAAGGENADSRRGVTAKDSRTSPHAPSWKLLSGPEGQHCVSQGDDKACLHIPMGKHWGKQQHLVLVPEESSDCVAWRTLRRRGPDAGSWTPRVRGQHPHQGQMTNAKE